MAVSVAVHSPALPEALATVDAGLGEYNVTSAPLSEVRALHVIATEADGSVIGGAVGRTWSQCCELEQLWVLAEHRGTGIGRELLCEFEREAVQRGCRLVYLDTFSFQAPEFYKARGYIEVLRTAGYTDGIVKFTMHKHLRQNGAVT